MRRSRQKLQVNTFPFLAVLLCAMGSLILFLLVMDRRAKIAAQNKFLAAQSTVDRSKEDDDQKRAEWEKQKQNLHSILKKQQTALKVEATQVQSQITQTDRKIDVHKAHYQEIQKSLATEKAKLAQLESRIRDDQDRTKEAEVQDARAREAILKATLDLQDLEKSLKEMKLVKNQEKNTFSVVPYRGKRGETRKPIYIECEATSLIFHPERKILQGLDFDVQPLRSEVERRAGGLAREKTAKELSREPEPTTRSPYVLFLVRPDGIGSYYKAQSFLKGFQLDFGYEFIDSHWTLDFSTDQFAGGATPTPTRTTAYATPKIPPLPPFPGIGGGNTPIANAGIAPPGLPALPGIPGIPGIVSGTSGSDAPGSNGGNGFANSAVPALPGIPGGAGIVGVSGGNGGGAAMPRLPGVPAAPGIAGSNGALGGGNFAGGNGFTGAGGPSGNPGLAGSSNAPGVSGGSQSGINTATNPGNLGGNGHPGGSGVPARPGVEAPASSPVTGTRPSLPGIGESGRDNPGYAGTPPAAGAPGGGTGISVALGRPGSNNSSFVPVTPMQNNVPIASAGPGTRPSVVTSNSASVMPDLRNASSGPQSGDSPIIIEQQPLPGIPSDSGPPPPAPPSAFQPNGTPSSGPQYVDPLNRLASPGITQASKAPPLGRILGNREFVITVDCYADHVTIFPGGKQFRWKTADTSATDQQISDMVRQLIARRQSSVQPGEPPYRPQVRFQVSREGLRMYYHVYPLIEPMRLPMTRENLED